MFSPILNFIHINSVIGTKKIKPHLSETNDFSNKRYQSEFLRV